MFNKKIGTIVAGLTLCGVMGLNASDVMMDLKPDKYVIEINSVIDGFNDESIPSFLANDIIPDDYNLGLDITKMPEHGTLEIDDISGKFMYVPDEDFSGIDTCEYALFSPEEEQMKTTIVKFFVGMSEGIQVAAGSCIRLQERLQENASDVKKAYVDIAGKRYRHRVRKNGKGESEIVLSRKCFKNKLKLNELKPDLTPKEAKLILQKRDGSETVIDIEFNIPKIESITVEDNQVIVDGKYFGLKPKVFLVDTETGKAVKMKMNKKQFRYTNMKGKGTCMDPETGDSELVLNFKKEMVQARYKLIIQNNVGCGVDEETSEIPEVEIE